MQGPHEDSRANHVTDALKREGVNPSLTLQREQKSCRGEPFSKSEPTGKHNSFRAETIIKELNGGFL